MILDWQKTYQERLTDAVSALARIRRGARIFIGSACGEPQLLFKTLLDSAQNLADVEVIHFLDIGVTPTDKSGYVSLGISVDITRTAAQMARYVVAEVNPNMPGILGDSFLHVSEISAFVESNMPLLEFEDKSPDHIAAAIGQLIADLIDNESTLQTGIGKIPSSVFPYLKNKKDLGIHTETFTDGLIDLIEGGVVPVRGKHCIRGKLSRPFAWAPDGFTTMCTTIRCLSFARANMSTIRT